VLGLAFKPDTDDIRDAKSIELVELLLKAGATVQAYDPKAMDKARDRLPDVCYCDNAYAAATGADALVVVTEWNEFRFMNLERIRDLMRPACIVRRSQPLQPGIASANWVSATSASAARTQSPRRAMDRPCPTLGLRADVLDRGGVETILVAP
jgi:UDPglucose 6-dehydrogenase